MLRKRSILLALILAAGFVHADDVVVYADGWMREWFKNPRKDGHFYSVLMPWSIESSVLFEWESWEKKRYTYERRIEEAKKLHSTIEAPVFLFVLAYAGSWDSTGVTSVEIPKDFNEYVFLEYPDGSFVRCDEAAIAGGGFMRQVGSLNESMQIVLSFRGARIPQDGKVTVVIGGLKIQEVRADFGVPLRAYYKNAPPAFAQLLKDAGIWK